jgi:hypothetical protein
MSKLEGALSRQRAFRFFTFRFSEGPRPDSKPHANGARLLQVSSVELIAKSQKPCLGAPPNA